MRTTFSLFLLGIFAFSFSCIWAQGIPFQNNKFGEQIREAIVFQTELNKKFKDPEKSPLVKDSIPGFKSLHFFEIDEKYIVKARFEKIENATDFKMKTSTDRLPVYRDFGKLYFQLDGQEHVLHTYQNVKFSNEADYDSTLFIPFNDFTNGLESYGGGRYIDFPIPKQDSVMLNFHLSYNPYCAYNDRYSCPIPPDENKLKLRIAAGVLKYH